MIWELAIRPLLFLLPPESVHYATMGMYRTFHALPWAGSLISNRCSVDDPRLQVNVFGLDFANPVGLAAGFDKNARWFSELSSLGFGHIEVGTITGQGQAGNPRPRLFRLPKDQALINRLGFNNDGSEVVAERLSRLAARRTGNTKLGINIGKTKRVPLESAVDDYLTSFQRLYPFADYFTINVSSPNTPGLRKLQDRQPLVGLITALNQQNATLSAGAAPKPILLKIAPDLHDDQISEIAKIALETKLAGIIATNTTVSRDHLLTSETRINAIGNGGLSGAPLTKRSLSVVKQLYKQVQGQVPLVGVGGIMTPEDAWNMIAGGASLIQIYTGFVYGGPKSVRRINQFLIERLQREKLPNIRQAIGRNV